MGREVPFKANAKCDRCPTVGAFDFMGDLLCHDCSASALREYFGPEYGSFEVWSTSGGASDYGVGGQIDIMSKDSDGAIWTRSYIATGEWIKRA